MSTRVSDHRYEAKPLFERIFRCVPFHNSDKPELETGNRIIMPQSSLYQIRTLPVTFPLFFKIGTSASDKITHCGVLEFTADEGFVHMPRWMMRSLGLEEGGDVTLRDASLSAGTYMKLRPHATAFVEVPDPKAVLERALRGYACLSRGDTFMVRYDGRDYYLDVLEVGPGGEAVSLIETDCSLEFAPPLDYVEPRPRREVARGGGAKRGEEKEGGKEVKKDGGKDEGKEEFKAFTGKGHVLGGRWLGRVAEESGGRSAVARGPVVAEAKKIEKHDGGKEEFKAFSGKGRVLGGPSLDAAVESGGAPRVPATNSAVAVGKKKRKRDCGKKEAKKKFKASSSILFVFD